MRRSPAAFPTKPWVLTPGAWWIGRRAGPAGRGASLLIVAFAFSGQAFAEAPHSPDAVVGDEAQSSWGETWFWGPESCPAEARFVAGIKGRLEPGYVPDKLVEVEVDIEEVSRTGRGRPVGRGGFVGHLHVRQQVGGRSVLVRDYHAQDCELLVDALALAVALAVDPGAVNAPFDARESVKRRPHVRVDGRVEIGVKPSFGWGVGLVVGYSRRAWRPEMRLGFDDSRWIVDEERLARGRMAAVRPALAMMTLRLCRNLLPSTPVLDLPLCAGVEGGLLSTRVFAPNAAESASVSQRARWSLWIAFELGLALQVLLPGANGDRARRSSRPRWAITFEIAGLVPGYRAVRDVEPDPASNDVGDTNRDQQRPLYKTGAVGARAGVGLEMRFQ